MSIFSLSVSFYFFFTPLSHPTITLLSSLPLFVTLRHSLSASFILSFLLCSPFSPFVYSLSSPPVAE